MMTQIEAQALNALCSINKKTKDSTRPDWEQRRYETARDILAAFCSNPEIHPELSAKEMAVASVKFADALCAELRASDGIPVPEKCL